MDLPIDVQELASRQNERVEWKESVADPEDVARTICALSNDLANMGGGYVVCGAREEKDPHGFQRVRLVGLAAGRLREVEGRVMAHCRSRIDPPVAPLIQELPAETTDARVLVFVVPATRHAHSYRASADGSPTYYIRMGRETVAARNGLLRELLVRKSAMESWDRRPATTARMEHIDLLALRDVLQRMKLWNESTTLDEVLSDERALSAFVPPLLERESLTRVLRPRNFALLLFGKEPLQFMPGAYTLLSVYPGTDRSTDTAERHELTGPVTNQAEQALRLLQSHNPTGFDKRSATPNEAKYPSRAIQEALVNALVHRDYEETQPTRITVFTDRIEITSPGGLPSAIAKETFAAGRAAPHWRNQCLSYFFNKLQFAQAEGQGIPTILRLMHEHGNPPPRIDAEPGRLTMILPAHPRFAAG